MAKFKVGDKVRVKVFDKRPAHWHSAGRMDCWMGKIVTIRSIDPRDTKIVEDKDDFSGNRSAGWDWRESDFEPVARREFIVIRRSGAETIAELRHDREVIKSAKATCAPSDTFDFDTGAKLAFDRLMGREEPKPAPQPAHRFKVGDRVEHEVFGIGQVKHVANDRIPYLVEWKDGDRWHIEGTLSTAPEPPKFYTGKVVCVEWECDTFRHKSAGRIAVITNGVSDYDGWNRMNKKPFESFSDFCSANTYGVFHEIKE